MSQIVEFSEKTKEETINKIKEAEDVVKTKATTAEFDQIKKTLNQNQEIRKRTLQYRKNKKYAILKYQPHHNQPQQQFNTEGRTARPTTSRTQQRNRSRSNSRNRYPTYASIVKKDSRTNNAQRTRMQNHVYANKTIQKLQQEIDELKAQYNPKNGQPAPHTGAPIRHFHKQQTQTHIHQQNQQHSIRIQEHPIHIQEPNNTQNQNPHTDQQRQEQTNTPPKDLSTTDVLNLIHSTMQTLNAFATRFEQQNTQQTHPGM